MPVGENGLVARFWGLWPTWRRPRGCSPRGSAGGQSWCFPLASPANERVLWQPTFKTGLWRIFKNWNVERNLADDLPPVIALGVVPRQPVVEEVVQQRRASLLAEPEESSFSIKSKGHWNKFCWDKAEYIQYDPTKKLGSLFSQTFQPITWMFICSHPSAFKMPSGCGLFRGPVDDHPLNWKYEAK